MGMYVPERGSCVRYLKAALAGLTAFAVLFAAAVKLPLPDMRAAALVPTPPPAAISRLWREAERIVTADCMRVTPGDDGGVSARFRVDGSIEGGDEPGDVITLPCEATPGARYLLYLAGGEGEEADPLRLLTGRPIPVEGANALYEGEFFSLEGLEKDVERQRSILTVPSQTFFYGSIEALDQACDEIVVARVVSAGEPVDTLCRSAEGGESTLITAEQVFLRVKVENALMGGLKYGDILSVVIEPYNIRPVVNAVNLAPKTVPTPPEETPQEGGVYLFFLIRSVDKKADFYFTVNPYEGYAKLLGSALLHPYYNIALRETNDLPHFVSRLAAAREAAAANG